MISLLIPCQMKYKMLDHGMEKQPSNLPAHCAEKNSFCCLKKLNSSWTRQELLPRLKKWEENQTWTPYRGILVIICRSITEKKQTNPKLVTLSLQIPWNTTNTFIKISAEERFQVSQVCQLGEVWSQAKTSYWLIFQSQKN